MSGGVWTTSDTQNVSTRPGIYVNFLQETQDSIQPGAQGIVAIIGTADWGLLNGVTVVTAESQVDAAFGTGGTMNLLARQALRGGASSVKGYRIGVSGTVAKAVLALNGTDAAPAATLTAKYEGARANSFSIAIAVNTYDAAKKDLTITESGNLLEIFTHTDNDDLVGQISGTVAGVNASRYVTAAQNGAANRTMANLSATSMASGNSGTSVTATEFTASMAALEVIEWNLLVPSDTVSTSIQTSVRTYIARLRDEGKKVRAVMGGQSVAGMSVANLATEFGTMKTNATSLTIANHEGVHMVFPGIVDEVSGTSLSGAQSAARAAGMIGKAGFASSVTKHPTGASDVTARLSNSDVKSGLSAGLLLFTIEGSNAVIEQGINTLTAYTATKTRDFRKIRVIATMDAIATTITSATTQFVIGFVNNDDTGRAFTLGLISTAMDIFVQAGAVEAGAQVVPDTGRNATADPDEFFVLVEFTPIDALEKVFITARVL